MTPTLSIGIPNFGAAVSGDGWQQLVEVARAADEAGVHRVIVVDHVVMGPNTDAYVWGRFPTPPDAPWLEPLTVLALLAGLTTRVRLGTGILIAPLRPAALLAKQAATLDVLSSGRLDLGVGTGWQREEYAAEGLDWSRRGQLLSDTLAACRALWADVPAAVDLPTVSFAETYCVPQPVQRGGPPIWVSGTLTRPVLERVVHWGDGWIPIMTATVEDMRDGAARLRAAYEQAGRDPATVQIRGSLRVIRDADKRADLDATLAGVAEQTDAGATDIHVPLQALSTDLGEAAQLLPALAEGFKRAVG